MKKTLTLLPSHFEASISISGIPATDIWALGGLIGAAIEDNVVRILNDLRAEWDQNNKYEFFSFIRKAEIFPDVRLIRRDTGKILLGIELKGWYLLSKEKEPSFRFKTTQSVCAPPDLFVMYPWALKNVLSGEPQLFQPFIRTCNFVARYRNYWWQHVRNTSDSKVIEEPEEISYYPTGRELIEDKPEYDSGNNFGRIARTGIMDDFVEQCRKIKLAGIEIDRWIDFLKG